MKDRRSVLKLLAGAAAAVAAGLPSIASQPSLSRPTIYWKDIQREARRVAGIA